MPATVEAPLAVLFTLPGGVTYRRRLDDLPNQRLAVRAESGGDRRVLVGLRLPPRAPYPGDPGRLRRDGRSPGRGGRPASAGAADQPDRQEPTQPALQRHRVATAHRGLHRPRSSPAGWPPAGCPPAPGRRPTVRPRAEGSTAMRSVKW